MEGMCVAGILKLDVARVAGKLEPEKDGESGRHLA
jgi:hypothetical protein